MPESPHLDEWIACIRSRDPMTFENAFHGPRPTGADVVPRLIRELADSPDGYTRGKFVELLGEMGATSAVPVLTAELSHPDQNVRGFALAALTSLGVPEGLGVASEYRATHPGR